jgi:hypothetical protein
MWLPLSLFVSMLLPPCFTLERASALFLYVYIVVVKIERGRHIFECIRVRTEKVEKSV